MNKEKIENLRPLLSEIQLKRYSVVNDYINIYGELIKKKIVSPDCAFHKLAEKYGLTRSGVRKMICEAGIYNGAAHPIRIPSLAEQAQNPKYFIV